MEEHNQEAFQGQHHHQPVERDPKQRGIDDVNFDGRIRHNNNKESKIDTRVQKVADGEE